MPKKIRTAAIEKDDVSQRPSPDASSKGPAMMRVASSGSVVLTSSQWMNSVSSFDVQHERPRRQRDGIRKRQPAEGTFQPGLDLDDAGPDIDARRIDVAHHVDIGAHKFDSEDAGVQDKMVEARGREPNSLPNIGLLREYVCQCRRNKCAGDDELHRERRIRRNPEKCQKQPQPEEAFCPPQPTARTIQFQSPRSPRCFGTVRRLIFGR